MRGNPAYSNRHLVCLILFLLGSLLTSCASIAPATQGSDFTFMAALPDVGSLPAREAAAIYSLDPAVPAQLGGHDAASSGVSLGNPTTATAPAGGAEWAVYSAGPYSAASPPGLLSLNLTGSSGTVWFAAADFAGLKWDWQALQAPHGIDVLVQLGADGQYSRESDGAAFFALLVYDGSSLSLGQGTISSPARPDLEAVFALHLDPAELPGEVTLGPVNGISLEIEPGSASWDPATHMLGFKVRVGNSASHSTSGAGGYDLLRDVGDPVAHIVKLDASGNPITPQFDAWPPMELSPDEWSQYIEWLFYNPNDVVFEIEVAVGWRASHNLIACETGAYGGRLSLMQSDGTGLVEILSYPANPDISSLTPGAHTPAWSPNRALLAFVHYGDLFMMDSEGDVSQITFDGLALRTPDGSYILRFGLPKLDPCWSPDGQRLAFVQRYDPNESSYELCTIKVDGTGFTRLTFDEQPDTYYEYPDASPSWSPDGSFIVFERAGDSSVDNDRDIWRINVDGSGLQNLTSHTYEDPEHDWNDIYVHDTEPAVSPDGTMIAFTSERIWEEYDPFFRTTAIYVMNIDGSGVHKVSSDDVWDPSYDDDSPCWSADGSRVIFRHFDLDAYTNSFCSVNPDGSGFQTHYESDTVNVYYPAW